MANLYKLKKITQTVVLLILEV